MAKINRERNAQVDEIVLAYLREIPAKRARTVAKAKADGDPRYRFERQERALHEGRPAAYGATRRELDRGLVVASYYSDDENAAAGRVLTERELANAIGRLERSERVYRHSGRGFGRSTAIFVHPVVEHGREAVAANLTNADAIQDLGGSVEHGRNVTTTLRSQLMELVSVKSGPGATPVELASVNAKLREAIRALGGKVEKDLQLATLREDGAGDWDDDEEDE